MDDTETHTDPHGDTFQVIWNARPGARARHEVRHRHPGNGAGWTPWYPYDDLAMTEIFGLSIPERYR